MGSDRERAAAVAEAIATMRDVTNAFAADADAAADAAADVGAYLAANAGADAGADAAAGDTRPQATLTRSGAVARLFASTRPSASTSHSTPYASPYPTPYGYRVEGAGSAEADGLYVRDGEYGGAPLFKKVSLQP